MVCECTLLGEGEVVGGGGSLCIGLDYMAIKLAKIVEEVSEEHQEDDERREEEIDDMITDDEQEKLE